MTSIPLLPFTDDDIKYSTIYESMDDFLRGLKQHDIFLGDKHWIGCYLIQKREKFSRYFLRFIVWGDGNWACLYDAKNWFGRSVPPGQYVTAYYACSIPNKSKNFYNLETRTASDLIIIDE
jgi:hypothetical protein